MKLLPKLTLAAASLVLSFTAVNQQIAAAANIKYAFNVTSDLLNGSGYFSFNDSTFSDEPIPTAPVQSLKFTFDNDPETIYTEQDDIDYPKLGPVVFPTVAGNSPIGLSYIFNSKINPAISYEIAGYDLIVGEQAFEDAVAYTPIPEPATLVGILAVGSIGWLTSRQIKSARKAA